MLVLEARTRVGGACTLEEVWPGFRISPCAYLVGLLHPLVIDELGLPGRGLRWFPASAGLFVPFDDGTSVQLWDDDAAARPRSAASSPGDLAGWRALSDVKRRLRDALRPPGDGDLWIGPAPTREQIEERIGGDDEARKLLFEWSMVEFVEHYLDDERIQMAYLGQGVIGTNASPHDPGTASIHFHHASGRLGGEPGMWGYVMGGMGMVSFLLCDAAREAGAWWSRPASRSPGSCRARGSSWKAASGSMRRSSSRTPTRGSTLRLLGDVGRPCLAGAGRGDPDDRLHGQAQRRPPRTARLHAPGPGRASRITSGRSTRRSRRPSGKPASTAAREGRLPDRLWTELYFQTVHDPSVAPEGVADDERLRAVRPVHASPTGDWDIAPGTR